MGMQAYSNVYSYFLNVVFAPSVVRPLSRSGVYTGPGTLLSPPEPFLHDVWVDPNLCPTFVQQFL